MKSEEFYKELHWFPGVEMKTKHDKQADIFDYYDLIDFATQYSESKNKELTETHNELLETHEYIKQQNVDVHDEWKELNNKNKELIEENKKLKFIIDNGLGSKDLENDISPMHEI